MRKILAVILAAVVVLTVGCSSATGKLEKIKSEGQMVVYTDPNFAPFEFSVGSGIRGVDVEIGKAIAAELGVKATFEEAKFDSILMSIKSGKCDISISGFTITDERKKSVDFSDPYINSVQYLILPEGSKIASMEDLAGKIVGVAQGYTGEFLMDDETGKGGVLESENVEIKVYNSAMEAALDLKLDRLDAIVMDEYVAKNVVAKYTDIETKELCYKNGDLAAEEYGVAVAKGNQELLDIINGVIAKLKAENKIQEWVVEFSS